MMPNFKDASVHEKWKVLHPFLKKYGDGAFSYATLQEGLEYFLTDDGYIAYTTVKHPVFAPKGKRIALGEPVCNKNNIESLVDEFLKESPKAVFVPVYEECASVLHNIGFDVNCIGYEPEIPLKTYNLQGNWKELDLIKRARNEAKREGITIKEEKDISLVRKDGLDVISSKWLSGKTLNDREIWIYARPPVFSQEPDVRKFLALDKENNLEGFVFYDPMYKDDKIVGYSANISRCDESKFGKLSTAVNIAAAEIFKSEGAQKLNLCIAPFDKVDKGKFNDSALTFNFFQAMRKFGNNIYNFGGLSAHKSKYKADERQVYFASNSLLPVNDVYLAFLSSGIVKSYKDTLAGLAKGFFQTALAKAKE